MMSFARAIILFLSSAVYFSDGAWVHADDDGMISAAFMRKDSSLMQRTGFPISSASDCNTESSTETHCVVATFSTIDQANDFVRLSGQCSGDGCGDTQIANTGLNCLCSHRWKAYLDAGGTVVATDTSKCLSSGGGLQR
eukprot:TRINITY_DN48781_c0_g1_i1.p1 TRINITY_DN48781_c0_g1~~TRINITY_DN48781_c0_g1_i1.p1  ORF type:complete len:139 (+),score=15.95 TRINITY_DN48781_c0_g1_i1:48-464(+)